MAFRLSVLLLLVLPWFTAQSAQERFALVIGNANYRVMPLHNPVNDATDMAQLLESKGFDTLRLLDASKREMETAIERFTRKLTTRKDAVGLFYYAGHGLEIDGNNYLVPVDADLLSEVDAKYDSVNAGRVLDGMAYANNGLNLVVLDACRNNPFKRGWRSATAGLSEMRPASGTLILYATEPRKVAGDGAGRNGIFTQHLLEALNQPDIEVKNAFQQVAVAVRDATGGEQIPWSEGIVFGQFYFTESASEAAAAPTPPYWDAEVSLWRAMQHCASRACLTAYLESYPKGRFASAAQALLAQSSALPETVAVRASPVQNTLVEELTLCRRHLEANRLTTGVGGTALACYRNVLNKDRDNAEALRGLESIVDIYLDWARTDLQRGRLAQAEIYLSRAEGILPESPAVRTLREALSSDRLAAPSLAASVSPMATEQPIMVAIPAGCFQMGSEDTEEERESHEHQHRVCVDGFHLAPREVTNKEFRNFRANHDSGDYRGQSLNGDQQPVVSISYSDAQAYAEWLSQRTGERYRLPTEAEWEYAARAGSSYARYWSDDSRQACRYANGYDLTSKRAHGFSWQHHDCDDGYAVTAPVASFAPNAWRLHDMLGNAWEWTCSAYSNTYDGSEMRCEEDLQASNQAVVRGGSWSNDPADLRSAYRTYRERDYRKHNLGFRLAKD
jgi:formylglycine-generating enzyme required for sulfatase activity